jgi:hypothetical protein
MKEKIAVFLCVLTLSLTLLALATTARAADGPPYGWVEPAFNGYDPYYDQAPDYVTHIVGYVEGTNWNLVLTWTNYEAPPSINVSAIRVFFDWGKNYTYSFATPIQVMRGMTQTFSVYNVTPSTAEASELWTHSYQIWIDHVNDTAPPFGNAGTVFFNSGSGFAVLSANHLECLNVMSKYSLFLGPTLMQAQMVTPTAFFPNITEAQVLFVQAMLEFNQGEQMFSAGVFSSARMHFDAGDTLITEALTAWSNQGSAMENADIAYKNGQANYYDGQGQYYIALGDASKTNAYGWVLFGVGWMFIGIGIIVYGYRRPKPAAQPPT